MLETNNGYNDVITYINGYNTDFKHEILKHINDNNLFFFKKKGKHHFN